MKILKSDFPGVDGLFLELGLNEHSRYEQGDYYYFQFHDLLKRDNFDWQELDIDTQDALILMGMVFFPPSKTPVGENEDSRILAKKVKANYLREHAKLRSKVWEEVAKQHQLTAKEEKPYILKMYLTPGEALNKPKQKTTISKPLKNSTVILPTNISNATKPKFLAIPDRITQKSHYPTLPSNIQNPASTRSKDTIHNQKATSLPTGSTKGTPELNIKTHDMNTNPPGGIDMPITPTGSLSTPPRRAG